ncbi:RNA-directed DNA polymerase, eukaryota [Artemisia annua]|uniref:RNA-directed DNA polymerase, eukaryota n=1 Tax=Artemisia annua TaxID=35608 RepID=A0A2U1MW46_ARTAN|nr:RNA-directed DNA polymerase, eukaryota [Artemisia annua]
MASQELQQVEPNKSNSSNTNASKFAPSSSNANVPKDSNANSGPRQEVHKSRASEANLTTETDTINVVDGKLGLAVRPEPKIITWEHSVVDVVFFQWLENDQNCLVRHRWINGHWRWDWCRDVRGGAENQQLQLLIEAVSYVSLHESQDKLWWDIDIQGMFSVGITRKYIDNQTLLGSYIATRWCSSLPRKVNIFMWRARLDKLPTRYNLSSKGIEIASIMCPIRGVSMESLSHVLFTCTLAKEVWTRVYNWCQVTVRDMNDFSEWLDWCDQNANIRNRKVKLEVIGVSTWNLKLGCSHLCSNELQGHKESTSCGELQNKDRGSIAEVK